MRIIKFVVDNDKIRKDPDSDFSNLSKNPSVQAQFSFSKEWDGFIKVIGFRRGNKELEPRILSRGTTCEIPLEALKGTFFRMHVLGKKGERRIITLPLLINNNESNKGGKS